MLIEKVGIEKMQNEINLMKETVYKQLGKKPIGKTVNTEWIKADISDVLN